MTFRPGFLFLAALAAARLHCGEQIQDAASAANPVQYLGAGARPAALGSAFTAVGGDLSSLYFNPAGLGELRGSHAGLHHHSWLGGIDQESLAFGIGGSMASFGLTGDLVNYGQFEGTDENGNEVAPFTPVDLTLGVNLAKGFGNGLSIGVRARGTQQNIKDAGEISSAGDLGAMWHAKGKPLSLGVTYSNFGPAVDGSSPSAALRLGLALDLSLGPQYGLLLLLSGSGLNSGGDVIQTGAELRLSRYLAARAGYQASFMDQQFGGISGLSAGLGIKVDVFSLDYAFLPYGNLGNSNRISLNIDFFAGNETDDFSGKKPAAGPSAGAARSGQAVPASKGDSVDLIFEAPAPAQSGEAELRAAAQAAPRDPKAWHALGDYYFRQKDRARMLEAFEKELALQPQNQALRDWIKKVKGRE